MNQKIDKAKIICMAYRDGQSVSQISKALETPDSVIQSYLKNYFEYFYNEPYKPFNIKHSEFLEELYNNYKDVYKQGFYSREQMCEILNCTTQELESMFRKYKIHYQWLKTYSGQRTLCNVSNEFYNSVKDFAEKNGYKSVRQVATRAINEFMLQQTLFPEYREELPQKEVKEKVQRIKREHIEDKKQRDRENSKRCYWNNPEKARERKRIAYWKDVEKSREYYRIKRKERKEKLEGTEEND